MNDLQHLFNTNATPVVGEAVDFMLRIVPHTKGHCFIALPLRVQPLFYAWLDDNRAALIANDLHDRPSFYTGIAHPDPACGFFCVQVRDTPDSQPEIQTFLEALALCGTSDYLIIRKSSLGYKPKANPTGQALPQLLP